MSATVINFESRQKAAPSEIPANEITRIIFENSPGGLLAAQKAMLDGEYEKAIDALKKETPEDNRPEVAEEISFCRAVLHGPVGAFRSGRPDRGRQADVHVHHEQPQQLPLLIRPAN